MNKLILFTIFAAAAATAVEAVSNPQDVNAEIISLDSELNSDGSYKYEYETTNGIAAKEAGVGGQYANGDYSFTSPEGEQFQVTYTADENGFQPSGSHLPTPPPVPYQILEALEYIRTHPPYDPEQAQSGFRKFKK